MPNCNEEGCDVLKSGKCLNNMALELCSHYSKEDIVATIDQTDPKTAITDDDLDEDLVEEVNNQKERFIDFHRGEALTISEANSIAASGVTNLVILAGVPGVGKTTVVLSMMHLFQTNASGIADHIFAGSNTLLDFEEKAHPSRIESERQTPATNRTTAIWEPAFMHIRIANSAGEKHKNLLFTDISGELFKLIKDSTDEARKFQLCLRANDFALFFDAGKLISLNDRSYTRVAGLGILKSLILAGTLSSITRIQIIFSRWDLFEASADKDNHRKYIDDLIDEIRKKYGERFNVTFFEISARPQGGVLAFGHGLKELLTVWAQDALSVTPISLSTSAKEVSNRQFAKFKVTV